MPKSEYAERIAKLRKTWKKTKAAKTSSGGGRTVPEGKYQAELVKAVFDKDKYVTRWSYKIANGEHAGTVVYARDDLLRENEDPQKTGLAFFKANMETLGLDYDSPEPKAITKALKSGLGTLCDIFVKHNPPHYQNVYLNGIIDAEPEEEEEEIEDEEVEEDEDTDTESEEEEEESDNDEEDTEEDEDDEEEEEEAKPQHKLIFPEGQLVTFKSEGENYEGRYKGPADAKTSIIIVEDEDEEEEWEVENKNLKRKPGRPKGARNKPKKRKPKEPVAKKKSTKKKDAEPDLDDDMEDEEWDDEWGDD